MAQFQINILGCGSATPSARHNPSCQVVDFRNRLFMIDCGEGAQVGMRRMKMNYSRLSHIFISHLHGDHCFGLPGLLSTMSLHEKTGSLIIYMPAEGIDIFRRITNFFCSESTFNIDIRAIPPKGGILLDDHALTIESFPLRHRMPCFGFIFREKPKPRHIRGDMARFYDIPHYMLPAIKNGDDYIAPDGTVIPNQRLTTPPDPVVSYAYCSDTMFHESVARAIKGVHTVYHEATYDDSLATQARARGHSTARQAATIARMAEARQLVIGHYSKRYLTPQLLVRQAAEEFPNVIPADEGLKIDLI